MQRIKVFLTNEPGTLGDLSTIIGKNGGNITKPAFRQPLDQTFSRFTWISMLTMSAT